MIQEKGVLHLYKIEVNSQRMLLPPSKDVAMVFILRNLQENIKMEEIWMASVEN